MTLACTWVQDQAGVLFMKWTGHDDPAMHEQRRENRHERRQIP
jgi:hypothetical protein